MCGRMPRCPKCNAEINFLIIKDDVHYEAKFKYVDGVFMEVDSVRTVKTGFYCPVCNEMLFDISKQNEAEEFLRGG